MGSGNQYVIFYLVCFIAFFAMSQGAVIWVFISEIFPNSVRSQGSSLGSFTHWIMAAIIAWTFPIFVNGSVNGGFYSFIFFSCHGADLPDLYLARDAGNQRTNFGTNTKRPGNSMRVWKNGSMEVQIH